MQAESTLLAVQIAYKDKLFFFQTDELETCTHYALVVW